MPPHARQKIGAAIAQFRQDSYDVRNEADVNYVRLIGIEFDSKTLRVVAEAGGNVRVAMNKLSGFERRSGEHTPWLSGI